MANNYDLYIPIKVSNNTHTYPYNYPNISTPPVTNYDFKFDFKLPESFKEVIKSINVNEEYYDKLIADKNYTFLCMMSEHAARISIKTFNKVKNFVVKSNDFYYISSFIKYCNTIGVKDLTLPLLRAMSKKPSSDIFLHRTTLYEIYNKLNLRQVINFFKNDPDNLFWVINVEIYLHSLNSSFEDVLARQNIDFNKLQKILLKTKNADNIFLFAKFFKSADKKLCFRAIKALKAKDTLIKFIEEINEPWLKSMRNFK